MSLFDITINLFESILIGWFLYSICENDSFKCRLFTLILIIVEFLFITAVNTFSVTQGLLTVIDILICFIYLRFGCRMSSDRAILRAVIPDFVFGVSNTLYTIILLLVLHQENYFSMMNQYAVPVTVIINLIHAFIFYWFARNIRKNRIIMEKQENILMTCILLLFMILPLCFESVLFDFSNSDFYMYLGVFTIFCIAGILWNQVLYISHKNLEKQKQEFEIIQLRDERNAGKGIQKINEEMYQLRHDIKHFFSLIDFEAGTLNTEAQKTAGEIISKISGVAPVQTPNNPLTLVLNMKRDAAYQKGIDFKLTCNLTHKIDMEDVDLFLLLSNLLDNAIQHIGKEKQIRVEISEEQDECLIKIINSVDGCVVNEDGEFLVINNDLEHGYGLQIIEHIVSHYDAFLDYYQHDNMLQAALIVKIIKPEIFMRQKTC